MFKKIAFRSSGLLAAALIAILWVTQGCNGKIPSLPTILAPAKPPLPSYYISDFEDHQPRVSHYLLGTNDGIWRDTTYGGPAAAPNTINSNFVVPNAVPDALDGSNFAIHVFGTLIAYGTGKGYEADQLICPLYNAETATYFDASSFTGIQFLINLRSDDTNTAPIFQIAIDQTEPPPQYQGTSGGICLGNCFNHYQYSLASVANGGPITVDQWQAVSLIWSDPSFNAPPYGAASPPPLSAHLNKIVFLEWQFSDNAPGSSTNPIVTNTDFWIDNVQFLP